MKSAEGCLEWQRKVLSWPHCTISLKQHWTEWLGAKGSWPYSAVSLGEGWGDIGPCTPGVPRIILNPQYSFFLGGQRTISKKA